VDNNDFSTNKVCDCCKNKEETAPSTASGAVNTNRQNHVKYIPNETLDKYVDSHERNCPCWCCNDIETNVTRQNTNLGITVGFG